MKLTQAIPVAFAVSGFAFTAHADQCEKVQTTYQCTDTTANGETATLTLTPEDLDESSDYFTGTVCASSEEELQAAELWMPEHGHGSAPIEFLPPLEGCTGVTNVYFLMPGMWEFRATFADGDTAVFVIHRDGEHGH